MRKAWASLMPLVALTAAPAVQASGKGCSTISAMMSGDHKRLRDISINIDRDGTVEVRHKGKADILVAAEDCYLNSPNDGFELDCAWRYDNLTQAQGRYQLLKMQVAQCLPQTMRDIASPSTVEGLTVHRHETLSVEDNGGDENSDISITLYEHRHGASPPRFNLGLSISH